MVASTSMVISDKQYGYPFHYLVKQAVYLGMGVVLLYAAVHIPLRWWREKSGYLMVVTLILLVLVLVPGIGKVVNGSRRWIHVGFLNLQVSELAKLATIIYLSSYLERFSKEIQEEALGFIKPLIVLAIVGFLLLLEPNFGDTVVLSAAVMMMLFIANVRLWPFVVLLSVAVMGFSLLAIISPYRLARLTTFLNPWGHQFDSGYQLTQSLMAFGRGGFLGVGLGNSVQKLFYLPEAHTDFLFAVIAEELGLLGSLLIVVAFAVLIGRSFILSRRAFFQRDLFAGYVAYGLAAWMGLQALVNIGVTTGLLPTKGLTLPLLSYGGSSLLINCIALGILFRIFYELEEHPYGR